MASNQNGIIYKESNFHFLIEKQNSAYKGIFFDYGLRVNSFLKSNSNSQIIEKGYLIIKKNVFYFSVGRFNQNISNESKLLSTGSLSISNNALPLPMIDIGINEFTPVIFRQFNFQFKGGLSHGWFNKNQYLKAPYLHQKNLYLKKKINPNQSLTLGIIHMAMWGGETQIHLNQPQKISDYLRIFFLQPASDKGLKQERINTLGNHLGIWDLAYERDKNQKKLKLYYQHPFEDESGARWLSNGFDGLYGIEILSNEKKLISQFLYEYLNTMNQSGSEGASDSTYGWDNYYNHYIYQSGWTYNKRVIGNPLFTLGYNKGSYSDGTYIINNRIKAHHIGILGSLSKKIKYKIFITYSKNFGIFPDKAKFKQANKIYRFNNGLIQHSTLLQLEFNNLINDFNVQVSYGIDRGELLVPTKALLFSINYNYSMVYSSK